MSSSPRPLPAGVMQDHGGNLREVKALYGLARMVDFSASINPMGHPPGLRAHLDSLWDEVLHYPDRDCVNLRAAVARRFDVEPESVLAGNGSAELIDLLLRSTAPRRLLLSPPDFGLYERLRVPDTPVVRVPRTESRGFLPDLATLERTVEADDLVLFSNPGNPCGRSVPPDELAALLDRCARVRATLVVDEAFVDFCPDVTLLTGHAAHPNLVVLRSLTKFYAIPGLRVGYLVASPQRTLALARRQVPWSVNTLAEAAGAFCLDQREWDRMAIACVRRLRAAFADGLSRIPGLTPLPSEANFLLLGLAPPAPGGAELFEALARKGFLVRHCGSFGLGETYLRLAVRTEDENRELLDELQGLVPSPCAGSGSGRCAAGPNPREEEPASRAVAPRSGGP